MANNSVVIDLLLQDAKFKLSIDRATDSAKDLKKAVENVDSPVGRLRDGFKGLAGGIGGALDSVFSLKGALVGIAGAIAFDKIIGAAAEADAAIAGAANSLRLSGEYSKDAHIAVQDFASALQDTTGVGDDVALSMFSLAQSFGLSSKAAKDVVKAAADLSAATGVDLQTAVNNLSAAYNGNIGKLGKLNPALKDLTKEQLAAGAATKILADQFGGSAAAKLDTFAGALDAAKGRFGDIVEEIGFLVVRNSTVVESLKTVGDAFKILNTFLGKNSDGLKDLINKPIKGFLKELPNMIRSVGALGEAFLLLIGVDPFTALTDSAKDTAETFDDVASKSVEIADGILQIVQGYYNLKRIVGQNSALVQIFAPEEVEESKKQLEAIEAIRQKLADRSTKIAFADNISKDLKPAKTLIDDLADSFEDLASKIDKLPATIELDFKTSSPGGGGDGGRGPSTVKGNAGDFGPAKPAGPSDTFGGTDLDILQGFKDSFSKGLAEVGASTAKSFASNVLGGKEGARKFLGAAAAAAADAFLPGLGAVVGPFVEALTMGKEYVKAQVTAFAEALPELIDALVEAVPVFIEVLVDKADEIIIALVNGAPRITAAVALAFANPQLYVGFALAIGTAAYEGIVYQFQQLGGFFTTLFTQLGNSAAGALTGNINSYFKDKFPDILGAAARTFMEIFGAPLDNIENAGAAFYDKIVNGATAFINKLKEEINDALGTGEGGFTSGSTGYSYPGKTRPSPNNPLGLATGGMVEGIGNRDSVSALLSPGELVVDRTTGPRLLAAADAINQGKVGGQGGDPLVTALLAKVIELLQQPVGVVRSTVDIEGRTIGEIVLELNRNNQRLNIA